MIDFYVIYNPRTKARECYVGQAKDYRKRLVQHRQGLGAGVRGTEWMDRQSDLRIRRITSRAVPRGAARAIEMAIYQRFLDRGWALPQTRPLRPPSQLVARSGLPVSTVPDWVREELRRDPQLRRDVEKQLRRYRQAQDAPRRG